MEDINERVEDISERVEDINQMLVPVGAGPSEIQVRFARTPDRTLGFVVSVASLLLALILFF